MQKVNWKYSKTDQTNTIEAMTRDELFEKLSKEPLYFINGFEEAVIRSDPSEEHFYVKFKGKKEFLAKVGSSVVADAIIAENLISKEEYEQY